MVRADGSVLRQYRPSYDTGDTGGEGKKKNLDQKGGGGGTKKKIVISASARFSLI